jgi:hypothetical protein
MNKKQLLRIKKAMSYEDVPEQKRTLRQIKKQYKSLSEKERLQFLREVEEYFSNKNK